MLIAVWEIKKQPESKRVCKKSSKTSNTKTKFSDRKTISWRAEKETSDPKTPIFSNPWRIAPCWKNTSSTLDCPTTISRTSLKFSKRKSLNEWMIYDIYNSFISIYSQMKFLYKLKYKISLLNNILISWNIFFVWFKKHS